MEVKLKECDLLRLVCQVHLVRWIVVVIPVRRVIAEFPVLQEVKHPFLWKVWGVMWW